jgi:hypothetical protein
MAKMVVKEFKDERRGPMVRYKGPLHFKGNGEEPVSHF